MPEVLPLFGGHVVFPLARISHHAPSRDVARAGGCKACEGLGTARGTFCDPGVFSCQKGVVVWDRVCGAERGMSCTVL